MPMRQASVTQHLDHAQEELEKVYILEKHLEFSRLVHKVMMVVLPLNALIILPKIDVTGHPQCLRRICTWTTHKHQSIKFAASCTKNRPTFICWGTTNFYKPVMLTTNQCYNNNDNNNNNNNKKQNLHSGNLILKAEKHDGKNPRQFCKCMINW